MVKSHAIVLVAMTELPDLPNIVRTQKLDRAEFREPHSEMGLAACSLAGYVMVGPQVAGMVRLLSVGEPEGL